METELASETLLNTEGRPSMQRDMPQAGDNLRAVIRISTTVGLYMVAPFNQRPPLMAADFTADPTAHQRSRRQAYNNIHQSPSWG